MAGSFLKPYGGFMGKPAVGAQKCFKYLLINF
jgi:hypothetical protein